ncbi:MAG: hypothetical protein WCP32_15115 [Bacteroidota bacterium]
MGFSECNYLATAGVVSGICYPPAKAGGNSAKAGGNSASNEKHELPIASAIG